MSESTTQKTDNGGIAGVDAILGGWLAGTFGFRSVFIVMAVIAALAVVFVVLAVRESTAEDTPKMDWAGAITLGIAFLAAYLAINEIEKLAGANWILVVVLIAIAAVFFVVFWRHEGSAAAPMVSTHYMKQRRTWGLLVTTLLTMTGVFAIMNGVVPAIAQDTTLRGGMSASTVSFATLTPYALLGLAFGPVAGVLASKFGYHVVLRAGLVVTIVGALFGIFVVNNPSIAALVVISVMLGISYAGTANIMLNGLGIVLSPKDNPGYLPGMNAGAFNLGAGLSFAVLYAVMNSFTVSGGAAAGYAASLVAGASCSRHARRWQARLSRVRNEARCLTGRKTGDRHARPQGNRIRKPQHGPLHRVPPRAADRRDDARQQFLHQPRRQGSQPGGCRRQARGDGAHARRRGR